MFKKYQIKDSKFIDLPYLITATIKCTQGRTFDAQQSKQYAQCGQSSRLLFILHLILR